METRIGPWVIPLLMIRFFFFVFLLFFQISSIHAADYHTGETLLCADCHVMHYSITNERMLEGWFDQMGDNGPYPKLLRDQINNTCLICHSGAAMTGPDVLEQDGAGWGSPRQAGMLNRTDSGSPYDTWKGHTLGSTAQAPGGAWSNPDGLNCVDCHMPHGEVPTQYRNLWTSSDTGDKFYNKTLTYLNGSFNENYDVWQRTPPAGHTGCSLCHPSHPGERYGYKDITFNEPDKTKSAYGAWCQSCHEDFHGAGGDPNMGGQTGGDQGNPWKRHPVADVDIGANSNAHSSYPQWSTGWDINKRVQTMSASGTYPAQDNTPSCMSCHRGHGTVNPFGLIYTNPDGTLAIESADSGASMENTCRQCHDFQ